MALGHRRGRGALKYRGTDRATIVAREKERQWLLQRDLGLDVVRYGWNLAAHRRGRLAARFRHVLTTHPPRSAPIQWWPTDNPFVAQDGRPIP